MIKTKRFRMIAKQQVVLEDFELDDRALKPREIVVRLEFTAISPGTECANYQALDPDVLVPGKWCAYPWTPGYAGCGQVIGVGAEVTDFKVGTADGVNAMRKPRKVEAASCRFLRTARRRRKRQDAASTLRRGGDSIL